MVDVNRYNHKNPAHYASHRTWPLIPGDLRGPSSIKAGTLPEFQEGTEIREVSLLFCFKNKS